MALFMDGPPADVEDLIDQDSGLLEVCRIQQIDSSVKLRLAHDELAADLETLFEQQRSLTSHFLGVRQLGLRHVVTTPSVKMWHAFHSLSLIYRDAYFGQLNDRFQAKWNEFRALAQSARERVRDSGIGIVFDPLARPCLPLLSTTPASETGGTFYFCVALANISGEESAACPVSSYVLPDGNAVVVQVVDVPCNAAGWNCYAGTDPKALFRQNQELNVNGEPFVFYPSAAIESGARPGPGQFPNVTQPLPRRIQRG